MPNFTVYELPFAHLSDRLRQVRQRPLHAMPEAAAINHAEFGGLEDDIAELPTEWKCVR